MQHHEYFNTQSVVVLAHRGGLARTENTLQNFEAAESAGVFSLETDVRTTLDNIPVLFHDKDLNRLAGLNIKVSEANFSELEKIELIGGGKIISLEDALSALPQARFNLDIKDKKSVATAAAVIEKNSATTGCWCRVLVKTEEQKHFHCCPNQLLPQRVLKSFYLCGLFMPRIFLSVGLIRNLGTSVLFKYQGQCWG